MRIALILQAGNMMMPCGEGRRTLNKYTDGVGQAKGDRLPKESWSEHSSSDLSTLGRCFGKAELRETIANNEPAR